MILKVQVLLRSTHMEPGKKETISQSRIRTDYRDYRFFGELVCNPQKLQGDSDKEIHLDIKFYINQ